MRNVPFGILAAMAVQVDAVGIHEVRTHVVVDVAVERFAADARRRRRWPPPFRMRAHHPVHEVDVVEVLLHNLIAAQPEERVPVAMLPLHVAPLGVARLGVQHRAAQIIRIQRDNLADRAVVDLAHRLDVGAVFVALRARS